MLHPIRPAAEPTPLMKPDLSKRAAADPRAAGAAPMGDQPFVLNRAPNNVAARRWAERAWSCHAPAATLLAAFLVGGCGQLGLTSARSDGQSDARLAGGVTEPGVTEPGDAERRESAAATTAPAAEVLAAYPSDLPLVGTAAARAKVMHGKNRLDLANLSKLPWGGGQLWLNRRYGATLPYLLPGKIVNLRFEDFRDEKGQAFPTDNRAVVVEQIELVLGDERTRVRFGLGY